MAARAGAAVHDLFRGPNHEGAIEPLCEGAVLLPGLVAGHARELLEEVLAIAVAAPFRSMSTPGGHVMSVTTTSCGDAGWVSDSSGYRYAAIDPLSGRHWPAMPPRFIELARDAADSAGFAGFTPDACLINRYALGAKMSLHQDRNERDFTQPIVSVSLGLPAVFLFGGLRRAERPRRRLHLESGDVLVWGGPARMRFHGIEALQGGTHPLAGDCRINLTFRKAS